MNYKEHKEYLKEFKKYCKKVLKTKRSASAFLNRITLNIRSK